MLTAHSNTPRRSRLASLCLALFGIAALGNPGTARAETINWVNVPIGEFVIPRYEAISGKRLLVDNTVAASTLTINTQHDLTNEEAVEFIKSTLLLNGFAIIEKDAKTDVLINAASKSPVGLKLDPRIYVSDADFPAGDRIITYVMKLDYISPEDALRLFQVVARPSPYSTIAPVTNVNAIVITDNVPLVRSLIQLKGEIDVPDTGVVSEAIPLSRADSSEVEAALNDILQAQSQNRTGTGGARANVVISPQGRAAAPAGGAVVSAPDANTITIKAVTRTNSILIIAKPVDIAYIRSLIAIYDAPSEVDNFLKRELKYIPVADFLPVAEQAIARFTDGGTGGGSRSSSRTTSSNPRTTGTTGTSRNNSNSRNSGTTGGTNGGRGTTGGFSGGGGGLSADTLGAPEPLLIGNTLIIGDPQLNNIVVSGPPEHLRIIDQLLDEIDIRPRQVYINAVIAQVTLGDDIKKGADLLRTVDTINVGGEAVDIAGLFRTASGSGSTVLDVSSLNDIANFPAEAAGLSAWGQIGGLLNAYIEVLENTSRFQVLSRPFVYTANNEPASIASGERVAVPTSTTSSLSNSDSINSSIGFEEVLLQLDVVPLINSKDEVTLTVSQTNENITGFTTISNNRVPNISTQTFETRVRLPNKAIVVLGGIIQEEASEDINGLPLLARMPGIRHIIGSSYKEKTRRELLIFLQPHIIESTEDLVEKNIDEVNRTIVGPSALEVARAAPEMEPDLFAMGGRKRLLGNRGAGDETFVEPPLPTYAPADASKAPAEPRRGLFKKILNRDTPPASPVEPAKPKRKGLFRRK